MEINYIYLSIFIIISAILPLLYYYYHNVDRKIERYFFRNHKHLFALLIFANFILIISFVLNCKFVLSEIWSILTKSISFKF